MSDKYLTVNIRAYLDKDKPTYIGEESLYDLLSDFSCPRNPGPILLGFALKTISDLKYSVGGVMEFLECEDNEFLLNFYTQNHFKPFDTRITASLNNEPHTLHQLLKFI